MRNLDEIMNSLERRFQERRQARLAARAQAQPDPATESTPRTALFSDQDRRRRRAYLQGVPMLVTGLGRITYRGQELRADDRDVWEQLMRRVGARPLGDWVEFTPAAILGAMGWESGPRDQARLRSCLERMQATSLNVCSRRLGRGVSTSLICKLEWRQGRDGEEGRWRVWIEPEIKSLFGQAQLTRLAWQQQQALGPLARRLYRLYVDHSTPYPRRIETLWRKYGADCKSADAFRKPLRSALEQLKGIGFLKDYAVDDNGLVRVTRGGPLRGGDGGAD